MRFLQTIALLAPVIFNGHLGGQTFLMEETVIIGQRSIPKPQSIEEKLEFINKESNNSSLEMSQLLARGQLDLLEIFQREPGVSIPFDVAGSDGLVPYLEGGSSSINIRGLQGNRVGILVDGIAQPDDFVSRSFQGSGGPGRIYFDPALFSSIDLEKNGSGNSLAGSINAQTESPLTLLGPARKGRTFRSGTTWSSVNNGIHQRFATAAGNGNHAISAVYSLRYGHENAIAGQGVPNPLDFLSHSASVKGYGRAGILAWEPTFEIFQFNSQTDLRSIETTTFAGRNLDANSETTRQRLRSSIDFTLSPEQKSGLFDQLKARAYVQESLSENHNTQLTLLDGGFLRDRLNDISYQTDLYGGEARGEKHFETGAFQHDLDMKYDFSTSKVESSLLRTDRPAPTQTLLGMAPSTITRNGLSLASESRIGKTIQLTLTPSLRIERYLVEPDNTADYLANNTFPTFNRNGTFLGTRRFEAQDFENDSLSGGLGAALQFGKSLTLQASTQRATRNPTGEELTGVFAHEATQGNFLTLPNPSLSEETSLSNEVTFRWDSPALLVELTGYWNFYQDFIESSVATGQFTAPLGDPNRAEILSTQNRDEVEIRGIEAKLEWRLGEQFGFLEGLTIGSSLAWSEGLTKIPQQGDTPLDTVDPWKSSAWIDYENPSKKWGLHLIGSFHASKEAKDITGPYQPTASYFLLDVTGHLALTEHLTFRAGLKNLLDQEYILWSRSNRGSGHNAGLTGLDTQPGLNGFVGFEIEW